MKDKNISICEKCKKRLKPENSATNFPNPVLSVRRAMERGTIKEKMEILEVGAGNFRNGLFILKNLKNCTYYSFDLQDTLKRFSNNLNKYKELGGDIILKKDIKDKKFDIIISTFVIETICPEIDRYSLLKFIKDKMKKNGILIASFRGYPGVYGTKYKDCPTGEGLISTLRTFIKPFSISEIVSLFNELDLKDINFLQKYRVDKPKNIHVIVS